MLFYLGVHHPNWLAQTDVPLFVSHLRLKDRRTLPVARGPWALDSGGFTQISKHHRWTFSPRSYVEAVRRYRDEIGNLEWASPMDWMCEPEITAKTRKTVADHQRLTIENYLELRSLAPELPFVPVLQGWERDDYLRHAEMYDEAGVDLFRENPVGIGSVCRRQGMKEAQNIVWAIASQGLRLHGYGFKTEGLKRFGFDLFASSDSMSWSSRARNIAYHDEPNPIDCRKHKSCANCLDFALWWRDDLLDKRHLIQQLHLGAA